MLTSKKKPVDKALEAPVFWLMMQPQPWLMFHGLVQSAWNSIQFSSYPHVVRWRSRAQSNAATHAKLYVQKGT
jgi:hypothetical protein